MSELSSLSPISAVEIVQTQKRGRKSKSPVRFDESSFDTSDRLDVSSQTGHKHLNLHPHDSIVEADDEQSKTTSPVYSETWEEYSSPRKTTVRSQMSTHRSRESGRLSPSLDPANVEVGKQPLQLPRFNEPLKLKKGRQFVDYQAPAPTVVYVPHKRASHGRWSNVTVQHSHGRYVVIEQRPLHTQFTDGSGAAKQQYSRDIFGPETSWVKKKAPWTWSTKGNYIERSVNRGFYEPYLPPMKQRYSNVDSKIGSLDNYEHIPGGGTHRIPNFKLKWDAEAKVGSLPNTSRNDKSPVSLKLPELNASHYGASGDAGSFTSIHYTPGGNVILRKQKFSDVKSQVGSLDNMSHSPRGGDVVIPKNKVKWKKESKVGSLDNVTHLPKSSNIQVFNEKLNWQNDAKIGSMNNVEHTPRKAKFKVPNFEKDWNKDVGSRVGSLANVHHHPGGGNAQIINKRTKWNAKSKIDTKWKFNYDYKSLFGDDDEIDMRSFSLGGSQAFTV